MLLRLLYYIGISCYHIGVHITAYWSPKARLWVRGRNNQWQRIADALQPNERRVWFHCASLGEFEQGRPVIEALRHEQPELRIVLTFYSPSGYEIRKNYPHADYIFYLPADEPKAARRWLDLVQPELVVFVKYEFWYFYLAELKKRQIPTFLISAVFRAEQWFFGSLGAWPRKMLSTFSVLFVQDTVSAALLAQHGFKNSIIAGDTRVDSVANMTKHAPENAAIETFAARKKTIVCGSTWPPDEAILANIISEPWAKDLKWIIAPHDIQAGHILGIVARFSAQVEADKIIRYSEITAATQLETARILVVDNIGLLSGLYRYGWLSYIGGGFGTGIHNTLEPAAWGLPIVFGPKFKKFEEAKAMIATQAAATVGDAASLSTVLQGWLPDEQRHKAAEAALHYISEQQGSTKIIMQALRQIWQKTGKG